MGRGKKKKPPRPPAPRAAAPAPTASGEDAPDAVPDTAPLLAAGSSARPPRPPPRPPPPAPRADAPSFGLVPESTLDEPLLPPGDASDADEPSSGGATARVSFRDEVITIEDASRPPPSFADDDASTHHLATTSDAAPSEGDPSRVSDAPSPSDAPPCSDAAPFTLRGEAAAIWALGWPMGVSYFCRMAMASTDSVMVGHYAGGDHAPGEYLAASALSDMITTLMVVPPLAFNQVLNALCGQAVGAGAPKMAGVWLQQSVFWLGVTMCPLLIGFFFVRDILRALGFSETICALAGTYARWNVFWPIPNGWYQCMRFYFQSVGEPRPAMWNSVAFLFVNALLNWIFVFGGPFRHSSLFNNWRGLGFVGAAVSLSLSRTLQPLVYWLYMFRWRRAHARFWPDGGWRAAEHTSARTREYLSQAVPLVGTLVFSAIVGQSTTLLVSRLGVDAVAATTAVSTATVIWAGAVNAMFSMVIAVRVGFHLGRGDGDAARKSFWLSTAAVCAFLAAVIGTVVPFKHAVVGLTTSDRKVVLDAARVLPAALAATALGVLNSLCTGGVFSGQGRQALVATLSFFVDIPLSVGGVAVVVLAFKKSTLLNVYEYQAGAALLELIIAYAFVGASDWKKHARDAIDRNRAR